MKYKIGYFDPPWEYKVYSRDTGSGRSAESHYNTMGIEELKALPVENIMADDAVIFMWVTNPTLEYAFEVLKAWNFKYKTVGFNWVKINKKADSLFWGMGFWTRANSEDLWIATKDGSPEPILAEIDHLDKFVNLSYDDNEVLLSQKLLLATKGHPRRISARIHQIVDTPIIYERVGAHSAKPPIFRELIENLMGHLPRIELFARGKIDGWDTWGNETPSVDLPGFPPVPLYERSIYESSV